MIRTSRRGFLAATAAATAMPAQAQARGGDALAAAFATPPDSAKPRVWWHWMNGNITREGIAQDLAWMKRVGIGGAQAFDAARATPQVVPERLAYMTPPWKEAFRFAARRARALDLELAIASSPGWSETGGPWVQPQDAMKKLVWSETLVSGGARFDGALPAPPNVAGVFQNVRTLWEGGGHGHEDETFYADVAVLAYPIVEQASLLRPQNAIVDDQDIGDALLDQSLETGIAVPRSAAGVRYEYARAQTVRSAVVFVENLSPLTALSTLIARIEASNDKVSWREIAQTGLKGAPSTLSFAPVTARYFRLVLQNAPSSIDPSFLSMAPGVDMGGVMAGLTGSRLQQRLIQFELSSQARINAFEVKAGFAIANDYFALDDAVGADVEGVAPDQVLDLTPHMSADGRLDWTPPSGRWKVLRLGYSLTGRKNHPASEEATGLEVDKYDATAVEAYMNTYLDMYRDAVGDANMGRRGLRALVNDSTEVGPSNWTPRMMELFQRARGYDLKQWIPALTGDIIGSRARSDAFLYDFRRTLAELHASEHYGTIAKVAHERGLIVYGESLEATRVSLGDDLDMRAYADIPMAALWTYPRSGPRGTLVADIRGAASIAHLTGRTFVACESLTSIGHPWAHAPSDLQPMIDTIFLHGVNRPVIHTSAHQPNDEPPGLTLGVFGQNFTRHETWAEMAGPWMGYIARNSHLLQQGRNVADVAYFYGEERPLGVQAEGGYFRDVPKRYAYDFISAQAILSLLSLENGAFVSRGGARYRLICLGQQTRRMTLPVLRKLAAFVEAGGAIVGDAPESTPSLNQDAAEFARITRSLWSGAPVTTVGQGRVFAGRDVEAALAQLGVATDFSYAGDADIGFVHRVLDDGDIYFVSNRTPTAQRIDGRFRVVGKAAEIWRADTGATSSVSYRIDGAHTIVPLELAPYESFFVVFRTSTSAASAEVQHTAPRQVAEIASAWDVSFQAGRGAPARVMLPALASLSEHADAGVKYFSGVATYETTFDLPSGVQPGAPLWIDLGRIGDIAEVRVNGRLAGTAWKAPYRVDIGRLARAGRNRLDVRVANLWVNRLIGDQQPGAEKVAVVVAATYMAQAPLRPSGLIGPVTLWAG